MKTIAFAVVCLAACGSKKAAPTSSEVAQKSLEEPKPWELGMATRVPEPPPPPPLLSRRLDDDEAVALVKTWLAAVDASDATATAGVMADDVRLYQTAFPSDWEKCPNEVMMSEYEADVPRLASCVISVLHEAAAPLARRLKQARVSRTLPRELEEMWSSDSALSLPGEPVFVGLQYAGAGMETSVFVAVVNTADGARIGAIDAEMTMTDD